MVKLTFKAADGRVWDVDAPEGVSVMSVAVKNHVTPIEGACGGSMVCGTCHSYPTEPWFTNLPKASPEEQEMLDFAIDQKANSRLACQIKVTGALEGAVFELPKSQR